MPSRHSVSGFSCMMLSNIDNGAGSVAVSALPALPKTCFTSGTVIIIRLVCCSSSRALPIEMPGSVVGMYSKSFSFILGINSLPSCDKGHMIDAINNPETAISAKGLFRIALTAGWYMAISLRLNGLSSSRRMVPWMKKTIKAGTRVMEIPAAAAMA